MRRRDLSAMVAGGFGLRSLLPAAVRIPAGHADTGPDARAPVIGEGPGGLVQNAAAPAVLAGDFIPSVHAKAFRAACAAGLVKAAFVGDSIFTLNPTAITGTGTQQMILRRHLTARNPGVTFTFGDFAIGAQTWATLNAIPTSLPAWYTDPSRPWLSYVEAFAPDILFVSMGNNAFATPTLPVAIRSVLATVCGWASVPSIVLLNTRAPAQIASLNSLAGSGIQALMLLTTGYTRALCRAGGAALGIAGVPPLGLIDISARWFQVAHGLDPRFTYGTRLIGAAAPIRGVPCSAPYRLPASPGGDFMVTIVLPGGSRTGFADGGFSLSVNKGGGSDLMHVTVSAGTARTVIHPGDEALPGVAQTAAAALGSGDTTITIDCRQEQHLTSINGVLVSEAYVPRFCGAVVVPTIAWTGRVPDGLTFDVTGYVATRPLPVRAIATDTELFGPYTGNLYVTNPGGGNGGIHPSEYQLALVDDEVLAAVDLCGL